jgi:Flp pilus assembly protein TadG
MRAPFHRDPRGSMAVEFAILGPVLTLMLVGIMAYGGVFWISHSLQELANDMARSTVGGLSSSERLNLALATYQSETPTYAGLDPSALTPGVSDNGQIVTARVTYDGSRSVFWSFRELLPMPSPLITRQATIQLGGY